MILLLLLPIGLIIYLVYEYYVIKRTFEDSAKRIDDSIRRMIDGVKTFFTVSIIDKLAASDEPDTDDDNEIETNSDESLF
jgi:hypothetical protein